MKLDFDGLDGVLIIPPAMKKSRPRSPAPEKPAMKRPRHSGMNADIVVDESAPTNSPDAPYSKQAVAASSQEKEARENAQGKVATSSKTVAGYRGVPGPNTSLLPKRPIPSAATPPRHGMPNGSIPPKRPQPPASVDLAKGRTLASIPVARPKPYRPMAPPKLNDLGDSADNDVEVIEIEISETPVPPPRDMATAVSSNLGTTQKRRPIDLPETPLTASSKKEAAAISSNLGTTQKGRPIDLPERPAPAPEIQNEASIYVDLGDVPIEHSEISVSKGNERRPSWMIKTPIATVSTMVPESREETHRPRSRRRVGPYMAAATIAFLITASTALFGGIFNKSAHHDSIKPHVSSADVTENQPPEPVRQASVFVASAPEPALPDPEPIVPDVAPSPLTKEAVDTDQEEEEPVVVSNSEEDDSFEETVVVRFPGDYIKGDVNPKIQRWGKVDTVFHKMRHCLGKIHIIGYTCDLGDEETNILISTRRAENISEYFVKRGFNPERLVIEGRGSSKPIADNSTEEGRIQNRRVEISCR